MMRRIVGFFGITCGMNYPWLQDKIWGWPGDEAGAILGMGPVQEFCERLIVTKVSS